MDQALARKVFKEAKIPYGFPIPLIKHAVELEEGEKRVDVFSEQYIQFVDELVSEFVPGLKDNPWVMGYYLGFGPFDQEMMWINETIERKNSPGRNRLMGILEERYQGDIDKYNEIYETNFDSFRDLKKNGSPEYPRWTKQVKYGYAEMPETKGAQEIFDDA